MINNKLINPLVQSISFSSFWFFFGRNFFAEIEQKYLFIVINVAIRGCRHGDEFGDGGNGIASDCDCRGRGDDDDAGSGERTGAGGSGG